MCPFFPLPERMCQSRLIPCRENFCIVIGFLRKFWHRRTQGWHRGVIDAFSPGVSRKRTPTHRISTFPSDIRCEAVSTRVYCLLLASASWMKKSCCVILCHRISKCVINLAFRNTWLKTCSISSNCPTYLQLIIVISYSFSIFFSHTFIKRF